MNARQTAKLSTNHKVLRYLTDNLEIVKAVILFYFFFEELAANVKKIEITAGIQQQKLDGITRDKSKVRTLMEEEGSIISVALCAYAASVNNNTLHAKVYCTASSLENMGEVDSLFLCRDILQEAKLHKAELSANSIGQAEIDSFEKLLDEFSVIISSTGLASDTRKTKSELLVDLFKENAILHKKKMLPAAKVFKKTHPEFYAGYLLSTRTRNPRTLHSQAAGVIRNKATGKLLPGVTVRAENTSYTGKSNLKGNYQLRIPETGLYTLVFEKDGFAPVTKHGVEIITGETLYLDIEMQPLA